MTTTTSTPIIVNASPATDQWQAGARQAVLVLGPLAAMAAQSHMLGLADWLNVAVTIVGPLAALASIIMGQIKTRHDSQRQTAMATILPDSIAQVRKTLAPDPKPEAKVSPSDLAVTK